MTSAHPEHPPAIHDADKSPANLWWGLNDIPADWGPCVVTVGVFAWSPLEPAEGVYAFSWLDRVVALLHENGIGLVQQSPFPGKTEIAGALMKVTGAERLKRMLQRERVQELLSAIGAVQCLIA